MILSPQSIRLANSPEFKQLLVELQPYLGILENGVLIAATKGEPYETIRYQAGRVSGADYLLGVLKQAEEVADGRPSRKSRPEKES